MEQNLALQPARCAALGDLLEASAELGDVPQRILLLPAGPGILGRSGRSYTLSDPELVITESLRHQSRLPVDWNHNSEARFRSERDGRAAGWIVALEAQDGAVWGQVEWTADGALSVARREYRYISPAFTHTPEGEVLHLTSAALTNAPDLKLQALNSATGESMETETAPPYPAAAPAAGSLGGAARPREAAEQALALAAGAPLPLLPPRRPPQGAAPPRLDAFVPRGDYDQLQKQHQALNTRVAQMRQATLAGQVEQALHQAMQEGKVAPATLAYHRTQCLQPGGLQRFLAFCQAAPTIAQADLVAPGAPGTHTASPGMYAPGTHSAGAGAWGLTPGQVALCTRLGLSQQAMRNSAAELKAQQQEEEAQPWQP